jgi:hypothetical protein
MIDEMISELRAKLEQDATLIRYRELRRIRQMLLNGKTDGPNILACTAEASSRDSENATQVDASNESLKRPYVPRERTRRIVAVARSIIATRNGMPVTTPELLNLINGLGIVVPGGNPVGNLASMLSKAEDIRSVGKGKGWVLK